MPGKSLRDYKESELHEQIEQYTLMARNPESGLHNYWQGLVDSRKRELQRRDAFVKAFLDDLARDEPYKSKIDERNNDWKGWTIGIVVFIIAYVTMICIVFR